MTIYLDRSGTLTYEDEERKRRRGLGYLASGLVGSATAPSTSMPKPFKINTASKDEIRTRAQDALKQTLSRQPSEPLKEYMQLEQQYGQVGARKRIQDCTNLYRTYYSEADGPNIVWGLASSPYTIAELDEISKTAYKQLFSKQAPNGAVVTSDFSRDNRLASNMFPSIAQPINPGAQPYVRLARGSLGLSTYPAAATVDGKLYDDLDVAMNRYQETGSVKDYEAAQAATEAVSTAEEQVAMLNLLPSDVRLFTAKEYGNMTPEEQKEWDTTYGKEDEKPGLIGAAWKFLREAKPAVEVTEEDFRQRIRIMGGGPDGSAQVEKGLDGMLYRGEITEDEYVMRISEYSAADFEKYLNATGRSAYYTDEELTDKVGAPQWRQPIEGVATPAQQWVFNLNQGYKDVVFNAALLVVPIPKVSTLCGLVKTALRGGQALASGAKALTAIERMAAAESALIRAGEYTRAPARLGVAGKVGRNLVEPFAKGGIERMAARRSLGGGTAALDTAMTGLATPGLMALNAKFMGGIGLGSEMSGEDQAQVNTADKAYDYLDMTEGAQTGSQKLVAALKANVYTSDLQGDRDSVTEMQRWLQSTEGGKPALGLELGEPTGVWNNQWDNVLEQQSSWERNAALELEMQMMNEGYVGPTTEFADGTIMEDDTGGMTFVIWNDEMQQFVEHPVWTAAFESFQAEQSKQSSLAMGNPDLWFWLNAIGAPLTGGGWKAKVGKLAKDGFPSMMVSTILTAAETMASVYYAGPGFIEYKMKIDSDPTRKRLMDRLKELGRGANFAGTEELPFDLDPTSLDSGKIQFLAENGYTDDELLISTAMQLKERELELLYEPTYSWVGVVARGLGPDKDAVDKWLKDNSDGVRAMNMVIDLGMQSGGLAMWRHMRHGVGRTPGTIKKQKSFQTDVERITTLINKDSNVEAASYVGGIDARQVLRPLAEKRANRTVLEADHPVFVAKVDEVLEGIRNGEVEYINKYLSRYPRSKRSRVVERIQSGENAASATVLVQGGIRHRQKKNGDVFGKIEITKAEVEKVLIDAWEGADGNYYSILPRYVSKGPGGKRASYIGASLRTNIANIKNTNLRLLMSSTVGQVRFVPKGSFSRQLEGYAKAVGDSTSGVANDFAEVLYWENEAFFTDWDNPLAAQTFNRKLAAYRGKYVEPWGRTLLGREGRRSGLPAENLSGLAMDSGTLKSYQGGIRDKLAAFRDRTQGIAGVAVEGETTYGGFEGRVIEGKYIVSDRDGYTHRVTGGREMENTIMSPTQRAHELYLGGQNVLRQKLRTDAGRGAYYNGMGQAEKAQAFLIRRIRDVRNFGWRGPMVDITKVANVNRTTAVAAGGAALRGKHTAIDPLRNVAEVGLQSLDYPEAHRGFDEGLARMSDKADLDYALAVGDVAMRGDLHYNIEGGYQVTRKAVKAFDRKGKLKNEDKVFAAIRRITADGGFIAYRTGGEAAFDAWLESPEGWRLIKEGRHQRRAKYAAKDADAATFTDSSWVDEYRDYEAQATEVLMAHDILPQPNMPLYPLARTVEEMGGYAAAGHSFGNPAQVKRVWVSPDELMRTNMRIEGRIPDEEFVGRYETQATQVDPLRKKMRNGEKLNAPWVEIEIAKDGSFVFVSQEGRHRAVAAKQEGIEAIPVDLYLRQGDTWAKNEGLFDRLGITTVPEPVAVSVPRLPASAGRIDSLAKDLFKIDALAMYESYLTLKNLGESLTKMAKGEMARTPQAIRNALEQAYKAVDENGRPLLENPTLDLPFDTGNGYQDFMLAVTRWAMKPNKNARRVCFEISFKQIMDAQMKEGVPANDAGVIAADWALRATNRVHFDLSQAWRVESKFRWVAWFATKHRKWNTWLARAASKYPGYAMAVEEFLTWMQERNDDDSTPEWEKNFIKAGRLSLNVAPWAWLSQYALESWMGVEAERGVSFMVNKIPGMGAEPSPYTFETSFQDIALPRLGKALTDIVWIKNTPLVTGNWDESTPQGRADLTAAWEKSIQSLPEDERKKFIQKVEINYAYRQSAGDDVTWFDCMASAATGRSVAGALTLLKPVSTRLLSAEESRYQQDLKEFYATIEDDPDGASDFFYSHPDFAMAIGAGELMPWDHEKLCAAMRSYQELCYDYSDKIESLFTSGKLRTNPEDADQAYDDFIEQVEVLKQKDSTGYMARMFEYTGEDAFLTADDAKYTIPMMNREEWYQVAAPEPAEVDNYKRDLTGEGSAYLAACEQYGLDPELQGNTLLNKLLYARHVQDKLDAYQHTYPDIPGSADRNQYATLYNTGSGKGAADQYMNMVLSDKKRNLLLTGTSGGKYNSSNLFYAVMSEGELDVLGFKTTKDAQKRWEQYAQMRLALWQWQSVNPGMTTSSGDYRQALKDLDEGYEAAYCAETTPTGAQNPNYDPKFAEEWKFSHMRTYERLREFGVGDGTRDIDSEWRTALDIVERYWMALDGAGLTTGSGVQAKSIARPYMAALSAWAEGNPEWLAEWQRMGLTPARIGIPFNELDKDSPLWSGKDTSPDEQDEWWED